MRQFIGRQIVMCVLLSLSTSNIFADARDKRLDIYWIDVEGGAATLVVTPAGESILFDTGYARFAGRIHDHLKDVAKLERLDYLVITHYDGDHYEGAVPLSRLIPVVHLVDNGRFEDMRRDPGDDYFNLRCEDRIVINPGDDLPLRQTATHPFTLTCIATRQEFMKPAPDAVENQQVCTAASKQQDDPSENANSTVFVLQLGDFRFFDAGDLTWNLEANLVCPVDLVGKVDVYQVTHHGLDRSNNPLVIQTLQPTISVMNNGPKKGTQSETVHHLSTASSIKAMYQLHKNIRPDGETNNTADDYIANWAGQSGNYIKLSVAPSGEEYTVFIPPSGKRAKPHQQTYQTTKK